jgi:hypothetical protein
VAASCAIAPALLCSGILSWKQLKAWVFPNRLLQATSLCPPSCLRPTFLGLSLLPQTDHNALRALRALRRAQVKKSQQQRKLIDELPTWQLESVDLESGPCAVCLEAHSVGLEVRTKYAILADPDRVPNSFSFLFSEERLARLVRAQGSRMTLNLHHESDFRFLEYTSFLRC